MFSKFKTIVLHIERGHYLKFLKISAIILFKLFIKNENIFS